MGFNIIFGRDRVTEAFNFERKVEISLFGDEALNEGGTEDLSYGCFVLWR